MTVSPVNFAGNIDQPKQKGGAVKAVASAFVPGLGQFLDGRNKDGAKYLGASVGLGAASTLVSWSWCCINSGQCFYAEKSCPSC